MKEASEDLETRFHKLMEKLKEHQFRFTPQRIAVLRALVFSDIHPSVEDVFHQVREQFPTTSIATVYKTVALLKDLGEILELGFPDMSNRYDARKPYPHPHVICLRCRKIIDPELERVPELEREIRHKTGFLILSHRVDFFGICPECQQSESL
ncbi:MAG: transcriptional repressor [Syntrophobacterales bacterium]|nr:transcriptional repressor [Syntrophobacterales bacterium]